MESYENKNSGTPSTTWDGSRDRYDWDEENKYELEEMKDMLQDDRYRVFGHGTFGENVASIFDEGLKAYYDREASIHSYMIDLDTQDFGEFKNTLDHWPHKEYKEIVLFRFPLDYYNTLELNPSSLDRLAVFFRENTERGSNQYALKGVFDERFIFGCYSSETGQVSLNPNYNADIDDESVREELGARLTRAEIATQKRYDEQELIRSGEHPVLNEQGMLRDIPIEELDITPENAAMLDEVFSQT
ncbi:MAG: hypothetical protein LBK50_02015 [Candidatus Nomurabacteria bacterium]|jgi:hypothetical protein|nr:hypothetical protein [Candidatus Nomurabacteria bacterium]